MTVQDLFIHSDNKSSSAKIKVPSDVKMWGQFLTQKLLEDWNILNGLDISINFNTIESESGTTIATAKVVNIQNEKEIDIPIIIKNFYCYPIDVMLTKVDNETIAEPITLKRIERNLFLYGDPFNKLEDQYNFNGSYLGLDNEMGGIGVSGTTPPFSKMGNLLDLIKEVPEEESQYIKNHVLKDEQTIANFYKNNTLHILEKIIGLPILTKENDDIAKDYKSKIIYLKKMDDDKINFIHSPPDKFSPRSEITSINKLFEIFPNIRNLWKLNYNEFKEFGETLINIDNLKTNNNVFLDSEKKWIDGGVNINNMGTANLQSISGEYIDGIVIAKMKDFNGIDQTLKLFIGKNCYSLSQSFIGSWIPYISFELNTRPLPLAKEFGCFIGTEDNELIVTTPFEIISKENNLFKANDLQGKTFYFKKFNFLSNDEESIDKKEYELKKISRNSNGVYLIPDRLNFILLKNYVSISPTYNSWEKNASENPINSICLKKTSTDQYTISGLNSKEASISCGFDNDYLTPIQTEYILSSLGCPMNKIAKSFEKLRNEPTVRIFGLNTFEKKAENKGELISFKNTLRNYKLASVFNDEKVVDSILSLNFINPQNIQRFASFKSLFVEASSRLAELLLASRIGTSVIPEESTLVAMRNIEEVIDGLEKMEIQNN